MKWRSGLGFDDGAPFYLLNQCKKIRRHKPCMTIRPYHQRKAHEALRFSSMQTTRCTVNILTYIYIKYIQYSCTSYMDHIIEFCCVYFTSIFIIIDITL